ncbi:hypothetical protein DB35_15945 [Streptomyces abyssalis]|uniref:Uncharacterized protein n=1 Tax=Streptomyces abyssalis TaxID=933944 RepID=A0A1E7JFP5_9ACTN|nr:hypothetical protein AN215_22070 [Streptomyces abyssalis]OEU91541.1 hypothetical protein DB35_15945 [Streptomyces abyssalis]
MQGAQEARQWQDRINKVLQEAATIDENAATRLRHNFQDDDDGSQFRGDAFAGGKTDAGADAGRASQLARKGEDMSLSEINELNALMKEHGKDPAFSAKFATSMGGQGTIDFWHGMRPDAVNPNDPRHKAIEQMRGNLGRTLATATGSGAPGMDKWKRDVIAAGDERQGNGSNTDPYGFQVMSDLMQEGEWDGQFLGDYGKEVLSFEREAIEDGKSPEELWTGHDSTPSNYDLPGNSWGNDPVTGLLTGVSHNPDAATDLFNDKTLFKDTSAYVDQGMVNMPWAEDEKESYSTAEYLLNHRQYFDTIDSVDGKTVNPSMDALGDAMFAASSGRTPGDTTSPYLDPTPDQLEATGTAFTAWRRTTSSRPNSATTRRRSSRTTARALTTRCLLPGPWRRLSTAPTSRRSPRKSPTTAPRSELWTRASTRSLCTTSRRRRTIPHRASTVQGESTASWSTRPLPPSTTTRKARSTRRHGTSPQPAPWRAEDSATSRSPAVGWALPAAWSSKPSRRTTKTA